MSRPKSDPPFFPRTLAALVLAALIVTSLSSSLGWHSSVARDLWPPDWRTRRVQAQSEDTIKFPWPAGQEWKYTQDLHNGVWDDPEDPTDDEVAGNGYWKPDARFLDFLPSSSDGIPAEAHVVLAATGGTVSLFCGTADATVARRDSEQVWVAVTHPGLGQFIYGHLDRDSFDFDLIGKTVDQGQILGKPYAPEHSYSTPCGAGRPGHLHWGLPATTTPGDSELAPYVVDGWRLQCPDCTEDPENEHWRWYKDDDTRYVCTAEPLGGLCTLPSTNILTEPALELQAPKGPLEYISLAVGASAMNGFSMDAEARYFAQATSEALVPGDTNGLVDIYLTDLLQVPPEVTWVSQTVDGSAANGASSLPTIPAVSDSGEFVLFYSAATNLISGDPGAGYFLRKLSEPQATTRLFEEIENFQTCVDTGWGFSNLDMSADARFVSFETRCPVTGVNTSGTLNVYVHDVHQGKTELASRTWTTPPITGAGTGGNSNSYANLISGDGSTVLFRSAATDLVLNDTNNVVDVFRYSRADHIVERVSVTDGEGQVNGNGSYANFISYNGKLALFTTGATNLGPSSGLMHLYLRNLEAGTTIRIDNSHDGTEANAGVDQTGANMAWLGEDDDPRYVVFRSAATNLVEGDPDENGVADLFFYDRNAPDDSVRRLIWSDQDGEEVPLQADYYRLLADEQALTFHSTVANLTPGIPNVTPFRGLFLLHLDGPKTSQLLDPIGIEVTQGTQCFQSTDDPACSGDNSIPLIAGKPTVVRAHVASASGDLQVYGRLHVSDGATWRTIEALAESGMAPSRSAYDRERMDHGLSFRLPDELTTATVTMYVDLSTAPNSIGLRHPLEGEVEAAFEDMDPLVIAYLPVGIRDDSQSAYAWPDPIRMARGAGYLNTLFPLSTVRYFQLPGQPIQVDAGSTTSGGMRDILSQLDERYGQFVLLGWPLTPTGDLPDHLYGWLASNALTAPNGMAQVGGTVALGTDTAENGTFQRIFAHEIGHNLELRHPFDENRTGDPVDICDNLHAWPYDTDGDEVYDFSIHNVGYDFGFYKDADDPLVPSAWDDFMIGGHCGADSLASKWVSTYHYMQLYSALGGAAPAAASRLLSAVGINAIQTVLLVSGEVHSDGTGSLEPAYMHDTDATVTQPTGTAYCLTLEDATGSDLTSDCFDLSFVDPETGEELDTDYFTRFLPYDSAAARLVLSQDAAELDAVPVSAHAPAATMLYPNGGESLSDTVTVTWTDSDEDGDSLTYALDYSTDDGVSWYHLALDLTETSLEVDLTQLPGSATARFQVRATDGIHTTADASDAAFSVPDRPPAVIISLPAADLTVTEGQPIELQGSAYDMEEGPLGATELSWASDVDGALGTASNLLLTELSVGTHTITLSAHDSLSQSALDTVVIEVITPQTPVATIARQGTDLVLAWSESSGAAGYRVYTSTQPYFDVQSAAYVDVTGLLYTDSGAAAAGDRYYKVAARYGLGGESAPSTELGSVARVMVPGWNLIALPFEPADGTLDAVLGTQLHGTEDLLTADQVMVWDPASQTFSMAWFCGGPTCEAWEEPWANHWLASDYSQSTLTLGLDEGFWLNNRSGVTETLNFVGALGTDNRSVQIASGWQILSYGFADYKYLDSAGLTEGGSDGPLTANQVLAWNRDTQSYEAAWYCSGDVCESWGYPWANHWLRNDYANSDIALWPGHGYWYLNRGAPFTWYNTWSGR